MAKKIETKKEVQFSLVYRDMWQSAVSMSHVRTS